MVKDVHIWLWRPAQRMIGAPGPPSSRSRSTTPTFGCVNGLILAGARALYARRLHKLLERARRSHRRPHAGSRAAPAGRGGGRRPTGTYNDLSTTARSPPPSTPDARSPSAARAAPTCRGPTAPGATPLRLGTPRVSALLDFILSAIRGTPGSASASPPWGLRPTPSELCSTAGQLPIKSFHSTPSTSSCPRTLVSRGFVSLGPMMTTRRQDNTSVPPKDKESRRAGPLRPRTCLATWWTGRPSLKSRGRRPPRPPAWRGPASGPGAAAVLRARTRPVLAPAPGEKLPKTWRRC